MNDLDFITLDADLPGEGGEVWYYPPGDQQGRVAKSRRVARVSGDCGRVWYGVFESSDFGCSGLMQFSGDKESFVIVQKGAGYRVSINEPSHWQGMPELFGFVTGMVHFLLTDTLVLLSAGTLSASGYDAKGHIWSTPRLVLDDLKLVEHDDETLVVSGDHQPLGEGIVTLTLRARDGEIMRGQSFRWEDRTIAHITPTEVQP